MDDCYNFYSSAAPALSRLKTAGIDKRVRTTSLETRAIALWSMVHGYVTMRLDGNFVEKNDEMTGVPRQNAIVEAILEGL